MVPGLVLGLTDHPQTRGGHQVAPQPNGGTMHDFHTSSYSYDIGTCVAVAEGPTTAVRDSTRPEELTLTVPAAEWAALRAAL